jgi:hypothetical protein
LVILICFTPDRWNNRETYRLSRSEDVLTAFFLQTVHTKVIFGDASTRYGVFKIISVLQLLIDWAEVQYRPWFEANAIVKE